MKKTLLLAVSIITVLGLSAQTFDSKVSSSSSSTVNEAEAHIAINPSDSLQLAVGFMKQTTSGLGFEVHYSTDGGNSWNLSGLNAAVMSSPNFPGTIRAGGGDIILAYDKNGKLYCSWIYLLYNAQTDSAYFAGFWASSNNSGQSFQFEGPSITERTFGLGVLTNGTQNIANIYEGICDRQWMAVDHTNGSQANDLYVGFVNYTNTFGGLQVRRKDAAANTFGNMNTAVNGQFQLSNLAVDNDGVLHYTYAQTNSNGSVRHVSSSDGGQTFSGQHTVGSAANPFPTTHYLNDRENAAPSLAIDGDNNLHVTWTSLPSNQFPISYYSRSTDGGLTWSAPVDLTAMIGKNSFFANVAASDNKVTISAYGVDATKKADYYIMYSDNHGQTFFPPVKVTAAISDINAFAKTDFFGDYTSSARNNCKSFSVWSDLRNGGKPKLYLATYTDCGPVGTLDFTTINSSFQLKNIYPNPTSDNLMVDLTSKNINSIEAQILSMDGKLLQKTSQDLQSGSYTLTFDLSQLAAGNYTLKLSDKSGNVLSRIIAKQ